MCQEHFPLEGNSFLRFIWMFGFIHTRNMSNYSQNQPHQQIFCLNAGLSKCDSEPVLVSYCCYHKLPWTWWLQTIEIYFHSSGGQKFKATVKVLVGLCILQSPWGSILASSRFQWPQVFVGLWLPHSSLCLRLPSVCAPVSRLLGFGV